VATGVAEEIVAVSFSYSYYLHLGILTLWVFRTGFRGGRGGSEWRGDNDHAREGHGEWGGDRDRGSGDGERGDGDRGRGRGRGFGRGRGGEFSRGMGEGRGRGRRGGRGDRGGRQLTLLCYLSLL
jgi:hypothetical protein